MTRATQVPALIVMLWLVACLSRAGGLSVAAVVAIGVCVEVWLVAGLAVRVALVRAGLPGFGGVGALLVGHFLVSSAQYALLVVAPFPATVIAGAAALVAGCVVLRRSGPVVLAPQEDAGELAGLSLAIASASVWAWVSVQGLVVGPVDSTLVPWSDVTYHAAWVRHLASADGPGTIDHPLLVGAAFHFYPAGSHMLPTTLAQAANVGALPATAGAWLPFGQLLAPLAAFEFGRMLSGRWAGLLACAAVGFGPDAAAVWPANPYLSCHWLQLTAPGGAHACAAALLAIAFTARWCELGNVRLLALAVALAVATGASKPQIAMASLPVQAGIVLLRHRFLGRGARWFGGAALLSAPWLVDVAGLRLGAGLGLTLDGSGAKPYLLTLAGQQPAGELRWLTDAVTATSPWWSDASVGAPYLVLATLGWPLALSACAAWFVPTPASAPRRGEIPLLATLVYVGWTLALGANTSGEHTTDALVHRPLVQVWCVVAAWTGARFGAAVADLRTSRGRVWPTAAAVVAVGLAGAHALGRCHLAHVTVPWGGKFAGKTVPTVLLQCADRLRTDTDPRAIVQHGGEDPDLVLLAVSERRAFLVGSHLIAGGGAASAELARRRQRLQRLYDARSEDEVAAVARELGVHYVVLSPGNTVAWPASLLSEPWFVADDHRVFELARP